MALGLACTRRKVGPDPVDAVSLLSASAIVQKGCLPSCQPCRRTLVAVVVVDAGQVRLGVTQRPAPPRSPGIADLAGESRCSPDRPRTDRPW